MKYTKSAAALALAGIAVTPLAQAQTTVTLAGQVAIGILGSDVDDIDAIDIGDPIGVDENGLTIFADEDDVVAAAQPGDLTLFGDDAIVAVSAETQFGNGLTAYSNWRADFSLTGSTAGGDDIHVGIRGDFGDFRIGEVPDATGFGQINDILSGSDIDGEDTGLSYTGSFGGFTVGVNWSPEGSSDRVAGGVKFDFAGFGIGVGVGEDGDNSEFSVGATYSIAGVSLGASYKDLDNEFEVLGLEASYGINKWSFNIGFEGSLGDFNEDDTVVRFNAGYDIIDSLNLSGRVNVFTDDDDDDGDVTDFRLLLQKTF